MTKEEWVDFFRGYFQFVPSADPLLASTDTGCPPKMTQEVLKVLVEEGYLMENLGWYEKTGNR